MLSCSSEVTLKHTCLQQSVRKPVKWKLWHCTAFLTDQKTAMKPLLVSYFVIGWNSCRRLKFLSYWLSTRLLYKSTLVHNLDVFDFSFNRPWPVWQYGLSSFQAGGTKLERFLPKEIVEFWEFLGRCQKVPKFEFQSQFSKSKIIGIFPIFFSLKNTI